MYMVKTFDKYNDQDDDMYFDNIIDAVNFIEMEILTNGRPREQIKIFRQLELTVKLDISIGG